jgi:hypothetical protein
MIQNFGGGDIFFRRRGNIRALVHGRPALLVDFSLASGAKSLK